MSPFRLVVLGILFILWTSLSYGIYTIMTDVGFIAWWQIVIVLCFLWLFYVVIWRLLQGEIGSRTKLSEESLNSALEKGKKIAAS